MLQSASKLGHWLAHLVIALMIAAFLVFCISVSFGSAKIFWPNLFGHVIAIGSTLIVAIMVLHSEKADSKEGAEVATSLFTFATSLSALTPMLIELLNSVLVWGPSEKIKSSVIYLLSNETGQPSVVALTIISMLVFFSSIVGWVSAHAIAKRYETDWAASVGSIFVLTAQALMLSEWDSYGFEHAVSLSLVLISIIIILIILFSIYVAIIVRNIPVVVNSVYSLMGASIQILFSSVFISIKSLFSVLIRFAILFGFGFGILWLGILPALPSAVSESSQRLGEVISTPVLGQGLRTVALLIVYSLLALAFIFVLAWLSSAFTRFRLRFPDLSPATKLASRVIVIGAALVVFFIAATAVVIVGRSTIYAGSSFFSSRNGSSDAATKNDTEDGQLEQAAEDGELPLLQGFNPVDLELVCASSAPNFGWRYASSSELSVSLSACRLDNRDIRSGNPIIVVGTASVGRDTDAENARADRRAFALGSWLQRLQNYIDEPASIYALNLGMSTVGVGGVPGELENSRELRPVRIIRVHPVPETAVYSEVELLEWLGKYVQENLKPRDYSECTLYRVGGERFSLITRQKIEDWSCDTSDH